MNDPLVKSDMTLATEQWQRYVYCRDRGHREYITQAKRCEEMYLGGGSQWDRNDREQCEGVQGRKCVEVNEIFTTINTVMGEQIQTRAAISFKPRTGESSQEVADTLTKLAMQIADDNKYQWLESEVWSDGIIQQRGYLDIRMDFSDNLTGDIRISVIDPLEVLPDPDAQSYDPAKWKDVTVTKWMSVDEIEQVYGTEAARLVENNPVPENDFGMDGSSEESRNRFGSTALPGAIHDSTLMDKSTKRFRVIDRQHRRMERQQFYLNENNDLRPVPFGTTKEQIKAKVDSGEWVLTYKVVPRVRWTVTTMNAVLHDEWSPYSHLTVIPFFPYFRRGKTRGLVDNAISPQEMMNKAMSNILHAINTTANSGWMVEQDSLSNMDTDDLSDIGMKTGLVVEYARGRQKPEKIQPNSMPSGHTSVVQMAEQHIKAVTGVSNADDDIRSPEESGVAYESKKFQAKMHLSVPLDNLSRTRHMLALAMLSLIQQYYTEERIVMITKPDDMGENQHEPIAINKRTPAGEIINDLTMGEYDVIVSSLPHAASFQSTQFRELLELKKIGVNIPDTALVQVSSVEKKQELISQMSNTDPEAQQMQKDMAQAELKDKQAASALKLAQAEKAKSAAVLDNVESGYSAVQSAQVMASVAGLVPVADELLKSAGFEDKNTGPIFSQPQTPVLGAPQLPANTHPMFPAKPESPAVGMESGIETPRLDGIG